MLYPDKLQGVSVTPEFCPDLLGAYEAQRAYLRAHPEDTEAYFPLSEGLRVRLDYLQRRHQGSQIPETAYIGKTAVELQPLPKKEDIPVCVLNANDVNHLVEGLHKQAAALWIVASQLPDAVPGWCAEAQARRKIALARVLRTTMWSSVGAPREIPKEYAPGYKPPVRHWQIIA